MKTSYIGLDLGTTTGYAILNPAGGRCVSGTWDLRPRRHEGGGMRYLRFEGWVRELLKHDLRGSVVGYEEVRRHAGTDAAHVYGGLVATLQRVCEELHVPYTGVPVGTIKREATGKGNAPKPAMIQAAIAHWARPDDVTDDEADALFVAECLRKGLA